MSRNLREIPSQPEPSSEQAQKFIESLYHKLAHNDRMATSLANALQNIIETGFQGEQKFLYELIQNADDEAASEIQFFLKDQQLIVVHNGKKPFSAIDADKICDFSQKRYQDKQQDKHKTGYKGIGFKSVFSVADRVTIVSGAFSFRFDKKAFLATPDAEYPWQIIPIWTAEADLPENLASLKKSAPHKTFIQLDLKPNINLAKDFKYFADHPDMLLFLRHIRQMIIIDGERANRIECKPVEIQNHECFELRYNGKRISRSLVLTATVSVDEATQRSLKDISISDLVYPPRLRDTTETSITFAIKLDRDGHMQRQEGRLFCYLPTQMRMSELPVLVNANFLLNPERTTLLQISQDNQWNAFLLRELPIQLINCMAQLAGEDSFYANEILSLLPQERIATLTGALAEGYERGIRQAMTIPCLPTVNGDLTCMKDAWLDQTLFYIEHQQFAQVSILHPDLMKQQPQAVSVLQNYLSSYQHVIDFAMWCGRFSEHLNSNAKIEMQLTLLKAAAKIVKTMNYDVVPYDFKSNLFIPCVDGKSRVAPDVRFPSSEIQKFSDLVGYHFVDQAFLADPLVKTFLKNIGVKAIKNQDIIDDFLIPALKKGITNNVESVWAYVLKYGSRYRLFDLLINILVENRYSEQTAILWSYISTHFDQLSTTQRHSLRKAHVLTATGESLPVDQTYLADVYQPKVKFQQIVSDLSSILSPLYFMTNQQNKWKECFTSLGAAEEFSIRETEVVSQDVDSFLVGFGNHFVDRFQGELRKKTQYGRVSVYHLPFIELIRAPEYAKFIWEVIKKHVENYRSSYAFDIIQFYLEHLTTVLASDNQFYPSSQLLVPGLFAEFSEHLLYANLPIKLNAELINYLRLKDYLEAEQCIRLLDYLNRSNIKQISWYETVLTQLARAIPREGEYKVKSLLQSWQGQLPAADGSLRTVQELNLFRLTKVQQNPASCWLKQVGGLDSRGHNNLATAFGIDIITDQDVSFFKIKESPDILTQSRLKNIKGLLILAWIEANGDISRARKLLASFQEVIGAMNFMKATMIYIVKRSAKARLQMTSCYLEGDTLVYKHSAADFRSIGPLSLYLAQRLGIANQKTIELLQLLISVSFPSFLFDTELSYDAIAEQFSEQDLAHLGLDDSGFAEIEEDGTPHEEMRVSEDQAMLHDKNSFFDSTMTYLSKGKQEENDTSSDCDSDQEIDGSVQDGAPNVDVANIGGVNMLPADSHPLWYSGEEYVFEHLKQQYRELGQFESEMFDSHSSTYTFSCMDGGREVVITWNHLAGAICADSQFAFYISDIPTQGAGIRKDELWIDVVTSKNRAKETWSIPSEKLKRMHELGAKCRLFRVYDVKQDSVHHDVIENPAQDIESGDIETVRVIVRV